MLENAIAVYLKELTEREFDAPFVSILRRGGYYDIHCLHGIYEFGKDFIAKRKDDDGVQQYAFQTKAGDVTAGAWSEMRPQLGELRTSALGHPSFDSSLPRTSVLVMTGCLKGKAKLLVQEYNQACLDRGERSVEVWERQQLTERMLGCGVIPSLLTPTPDLLGLLSSIEKDEVVQRDLERYTRCWVGRTGTPAEFWSVFLEAGILAHMLLCRGRTNLSVAVALAAFRAVEAARLGGQKDGLWKEGRSLADLLFTAYSGHVLSQVSPLLGTLDGFFSGHAQSYSAPVSHTVRCCLAAEMLGLAGLHALLCDKHGEADRFAVWLDDLLKNNKAASHPISDRYAVSVMIVACLLFVTGRQLAGRSYLAAIVKWVCDAYERGYGLAEVNATELHELNSLLGYAFKHVAVSDRSGSYLATVVLDMLAAAGETDLYQDALNDFLAVGCICCQNAPNPEDGRFFGEAEGTFYHPNIHYAERLPDGTVWEVAAHHRLEQCHGPSLWGAIAISGLVRDRHWVPVVRLILQNHVEAPTAVSERSE